MIYLLKIILLLLSLNKVITPSKIELQSNSLLANKDGLVHYWPFDSHMQDIVGGAHLRNGSKASLTFDRKGRPLSALYIKNGFYELPSINYFKTGKFTLSLWVKAKSLNNWSRLFDFFDGYQFNSLTFVLSQARTGKVCIFLRSGSTLTYSAYANRNITVNEWTHLMFTYNSSNVRIYFNSELTADILSSNQISNGSKSFNYIGKSSKTLDENLNAIVDDIKIFNRALNQTEIENEMK